MSQRPKTGFPPARPLYALNFPKQDCVNTSKNGDCILRGAEKSPPGTDHFRQTLARQTKFHSATHPTTHSVENYYFLQLPKSYLFLNNTFFCKWENSLATSDTFEGVWAAAQGDSVLTVAVGGLLDDVGVGGFVYNAHNEVTAQKGRNIPMGKIVGKSWIRSVRTDLQDNFTALAKIARFETTDGVNKLLFTRKFRH